MSWNISAGRRPTQRLCPVTGNSPVIRSTKRANNDIHSFYCRLRPKSTEPPITGTTFHKFDLPVPQELRDFCTDEKVKS